jgi:hypothetical protein
MADSITEEFHDILIVDDPLWSEAICQTIEEGIKSGSPIEAAVLEAGVPRKTYRKWWTIDTFRDWAKGVQLKYFAQIRKNIHSNIPEIDIVKDRVAQEMKYLEHIDPEFNVKSKVEIEKTGKDDDDAYDDEFNRMLDEAEKAQKEAYKKIKEESKENED